MTHSPSIEWSTPMGSSAKDLSNMRNYIGIGGGLLAGLAAVIGLMSLSA
jgi:hypothetical protein